MVVLPQYVMVVLKGLGPMAFGGTQEPAAYGELVSIGGLNPDVNKKLSAGIASILESKLSVPKSRFYLKFYDSKVSSHYSLLIAHSWVFITIIMFSLDFCSLLGPSGSRTCSTANGRPVQRSIVYFKGHLYFLCL